MAMLQMVVEATIPPAVQQTATEAAVPPAAQQTAAVPPWAAVKSYKKVFF